MSSSTNINKSQRIAMNTIILFIRMFVLTLINLYTVRLVLKGLGVIDYGIFNAVAGVVTTSAFLISILELAIQRFYSISLGKNDQETLNQIFSISLKITIFISIKSFCNLSCNQSRIDRRLLSRYSLLISVFTVTSNKTSFTFFGK